MKKKILFLIVLSLVLFGFNKVYAIEDRFCEKEYVKYKYIKKINNITNEESIEDARFIRRNGDANFVYSLTPFGDFNENKLIEGYDSNYENYINISLEKLNKIFLIAYYGYLYPEHYAMSWYVITQTMIYNELDGISAKVVDYRGNEINVENEMNEINNLIEKHNVIPSFSNKTFNINLNEEYKLIDENNVLENFIIANNLEGIEKTGNELTVTSNLLPLNIELKKIYERYNRNPTIYIDESGKNLLLPGNFKEQVVNVSFNEIETEELLDDQNKEDIDIEEEIKEEQVEIEKEKEDIKEELPKIELEEEKVEDKFEEEISKEEILEPIIEETSKQEIEYKSNNEELITEKVEVPNTYIKSKFNLNFGILLVVLGLIILYKDKIYEK